MTAAEPLLVQCLTSEPVTWNDALPQGWDQWISQSDSFVMPDPSFSGWLEELPALGCTFHFFHPTPKASALASNAYAGQQKLRSALSFICAFLTTFNTLLCSRLLSTLDNPLVTCKYCPSCLRYCLANVEKLLEI